MKPDEKELIQNAAAGNRQAFTELVRLHQNKVFAFIMRMTGNRDIALDLTQDALLAAYENLGNFRGDSAFSTWLIQIALNKTRNFIKRAGREVPLPDQYETESAPDNPEQELVEKEDKSRLLEAIKTLPEKQRAVFNLRFFEQMKFGEIAKVQNRSVSAVKTNFAEAVKKLKALLVTS